MKEKKNKLARELRGEGGERERERERMERERERAHGDREWVSQRER